MKISPHSFIKITFYSVFILVFLFVFTSCNNGTSKANKSKTELEDAEDAEDAETFSTIYWNVKAIQPDGKSLDVKAFDDQGKAYELKAIQNSDQDNFLDVKVIIDGKNLPVKILESKNQFVPVAAINQDGDKYYIKAITPEGKKLDVKGVARFGYVVLMKAITKDGKYYGVKAISPDGKLNDIKGVKINYQDREMSLKGVGIHAHVKAMHPAVNEDELKIPAKAKKKKIYKSDFKRIIWNIKAVTTNGENLDIKAFDANGNKFDVKATQDSKDHSFMNIKAFVDGVELPVKILQSTDAYAPVKAIGTDGTIYDIKALTKDNVRLDVKGVSRSGNIVNVKAINENGELLAVKAFAPDGKLNNVKGIKIFQREIELRVKGNPVYAHLKAIN